MTQFPATSSSQTAYAEAARRAVIRAVVIGVIVVAAGVAVILTMG